MSLSELVKTAEVVVDDQILAARGEPDSALRAMVILDDPTREFASSEFVRLEVLPTGHFLRANEVCFING